MAVDATTSTSSPLTIPVAVTADDAVAVLVERARRIPALGIAGIIYGVSRVVSLAFFYAVYGLAPVLHLPYSSYGTTRPSFITLLSGWDGAYYRQIALHGYPSQLPVDASGHVVSNSWAFLPVYPWITRGLMVTTGLGFAPAGVILSLVFGLIAAGLLYRILQERLGERRALWAVALFCVGPLAFVFDLAYAESLFLVLVFACLLLFARRNYLASIPFGVAAAFTRPGELALAAALGLLFIAQLARREPIAHGERIRMVVAGVSFAVAGFAWPVIANSVTGNKSAYFDTELSWWTGWVGRVHFIPFTPWFELFYRYVGVTGVVFVLLCVGAFVFWLTRRSMRVLGDEILAFSGSYGAYLVAVFLPQQSIVRMLLPMSPLLGAPIFTGSRRVRRIMVIALVALQPVLIAVLWFMYPP